MKPIIMVYLVLLLFVGIVGVFKDVSIDSIGILVLVTMIMSLCTSHWPNTLSFFLLLVGPRLVVSFFYPKPGFLNYIEIR